MRTKEFSIIELLVAVTAAAFLISAIIPLIKMYKTYNQLVQEGIEDPTHEMISLRMKIQVNSGKDALIKKYNNLREEEQTVTEFEKDFGKYK